MRPGTFVRKVSARAAASEIDRDEDRLTPELAELIKRTFRGVHVLAYLKHEVRVTRLSAIRRGCEWRRLSSTDGCPATTTERDGVLPHAPCACCQVLLVQFGT